MEHKHHLRGFAMVAFSILVWSGWVVVSRYGVQSTLTAYDITAIRFTVAGILMLPVMLRKGFSVGPWGVWSALLLSVLIGACYTNVVVAGMKFAPVSHASTVNAGTFLTIITVVGIHGLREHVSKLRLIGVMLSLTGIGVMLFARDAGAGDKQWLGHLCFIAGGAMWSSYVLLTRAWRADAIHAAAAVCVFSMLTYMPLYLLFADHHIGLYNWHDVALQFVYQGILTGVVALISFNHAVHILGAARAGAFVPLIPAISTLLAVPTLHEVPSLVEILGIATVSIGVFLASGAVGWKRASIPSGLQKNVEIKHHH